MPGPPVPASECLRGLPATEAPHAPWAAPSATPPALRPSPAPSPPLFTAIFSTRELSPGRETRGRTTPLIAHWPTCQSPAPQVPHCANGAPPGCDSGRPCPFRGFAPRSPSFGSAAMGSRRERQRHDAARVTGKVWLKHRRVQKKVSRQRGS